MLDQLLTAKQDYQYLLDRLKPIVYFKHETLDTNQDDCAVSQISNSKQMHRHL